MFYTCYQGFQMLSKSAKYGSKLGPLLLIRTCPQGSFESMNRRSCAWVNYSYIHLSSGVASRNQPQPGGSGELLIRSLRVGSPTYAFPGGAESHLNLGWLDNEMRNHIIVKWIHHQYVIHKNPTMTIFYICYISLLEGVRTLNLWIPSLTVPPL